MKNKFSSGEKGKNDIDFDGIIDAAYGEWKVKGNDYWSFKPHDNAVFNNRVLKLADKQKVAFITDSVYQIANYNKGRTTWHSHDKGWQLQNIRDNFLQHLLKTKLVLDDDDIATIVTAFASCCRHDRNDHIIFWPVNLLVNQVEKQFRHHPISDKLRKTLQLLSHKIKPEVSVYHEKEQARILGKIENLLFHGEKGTDAVKPTFFPGEDDFGNYANQTIRELDESDQLRWFKLMLHSQKASGGKPSKRFLDESKALFREFGADRFKQHVNKWFSFLTGLKEKTEEHTSLYGGSTHTYTTTQFLAAANTDMIRGFVWMCVHFHDKNTLFAIAALAERSFRKIPGKGPAAASIGNACLYVLAHSRGLDGLGHLSRLRLRIKQSTTQNLIEKYLLEAAAEHGVSIHEIEDMAVDDYGLEAGRKEYEFDGYKAVLQITGVGKTELSWYKPDGSPQKSEPSAIKQTHAAKLKKLRDTRQQIELTVSAQRDRLDRMFKSNRAMGWPQFMEFYFSHGLMCYLTDLLIWRFEKEGQMQAAFFFDGRWVCHHNEELAFPVDEDTVVSLWHPVFCCVEEVRSWREFMMEHQIVQPLKQAFREVYLLTDAEISTVTYSNRMAAHILKQHQFNSLAKTRGWKYSLLGAYDDGRSNEIASVELPDYGLKAEFWVNEVNADNAMNDTGIWLYISTDQVRFVNMVSGNAVQLIEVPPVVLSEVMRDVDLFVGVASVGNDPAWQDSGGLPVYRDYWQSYSFGELTEVARTRKSLLERLLPRLAIAKVAELRDKFLVVKGTLRTYKIHIGSTNILMEPNDQYLCIVPDRSQRNAAGTVFLPFEGDTGLSVILSKALLLAHDDKITDPTITRQIQSR